MLKLFKSFQYMPASFALITMNLIPLFGVMALDWDVGTIILLYWLENVVIGLLNIVKIISCRGDLPRARATVANNRLIPTDQNSDDRPRRFLGGLIFLAVFFSFHYGMFCMGHYMFIESAFEDLPRLADIPSALFSGFLFWSLLGLTLSHIVSMIVNFYGKGEYLTCSPNSQMFMPYTRIVVLHMVIIFSGTLAVMFEEGLAMLILLVAIKTCVDLAAHQVEHSDVKTLLNPKIAEET